ncbi:MAG TPA: EamA family transporter [Candidatus Peribacterales bacterium]|nr:EamA family transporter [Candidatus Peribacterales bacterium]
MWLFFALLTPLFWAVVHVMDARCVDDFFEKPWMGAVTSAIASLVVFIPLPFLLISFDFILPDIRTALLALFAGMLIQLSQVFYFQSLKYSESGIVAAYWNMVPAMLPFASFFIMGAVFPTEKYFGMMILIVASIGMCLIDTNLNARWKSFFLMFVASSLQVVLFLVEDHVYAVTPFLTGFYIITSGLILTGIAPLASPAIFSLFRRNVGILQSGAAIFLGIEVINLIALFTSQKAVDLGDPPLVAAVESTIPAYTFLLSGMLLVIFPAFGDPLARKNFALKIFLVAMMAVGVYLVA